jgi:hypothetical protein
MKTTILVAVATLAIVLSAAPTFAGQAPYRSVKEKVHHNRVFRTAPVTDDGPVIALPG